ncbi:MAG: hypothetical protein AAGK17_06460 [Pseudomonadota bacterium]
MIATWPCSLADGATSDELLVTIGEGDKASLLVIPPLFAEHNLMRRQMVLVMRALANHGIVSHLPDLPGWNESLAPLRLQTLDGWRSVIAQAAEQFGTTHVFAVRSGALLCPPQSQGWLYAPQSGAKLLRAMIRAQGISNREAGIEETSEHMAERGRAEGITLAGWEIGAPLFGELEAAEPLQSDGLTEIAQNGVGSPGLWLRAEPGENAEQAERIAALIAKAIDS